MAFQFDITLSRLALVSYALKLWDEGDMPCKLEQFYYSDGKQGKMPYLKELVDETVKKISSKLTPENIYSELVQVIEEIAFKKHDWFNFLMRKKIFQGHQSRKQFYDIYLKDIFWTYFGTIDEFRIMKYSWFNNPKIDLTKLYVMACCFCFKDLIEELWGKIRFYMRYSVLKSRIGFHLVIYWNKLRENKLEDVLSDCIVPFAGKGIYEIDKSVEVNMLKLSISKGFVSAVKYFWNQLRDQERIDNIVQGLKSALDEYDKKSDEESYKKDLYAEIFLFLLNFASNEAKRIIFVEEKYLKNVLDISIKWPWIEFFNRIFLEVQDFLSEGICELLVCNLIVHSSGEKSFYHNMLRLIWNRIPDHFKISALTKNSLSFLFMKWDLKNIKLMLNDENMTPVRDKMIIFLTSSVIPLIYNNKLKKLNQFVNEILLPSNLIDHIRDIIMSIYEFIIKGQIYEAIKHVNELPEQFIEGIKHEIDPYFLCYYLVIKSRFDLADEFLSWKFSAEEASKFKRDFKEIAFVKNHIRYLWYVYKENVKVAQQNCDEFLIWLLGSEKSVAFFKITEIASEFFNSTCTPFVNIDVNFDVLDDFLHWSLLNELAVKTYKVHVFRHKQLKCSFTHFVKIGRFEDALKICKWAFDSDEEASYAYMRKILLSDLGLMHIKLFISEYSLPDISDPQPDIQDLKAKFSEFVDFLIKPLDFVDLLDKLSNWADESETYFEKMDSDDDPSAETVSEEDSENDEEVVKPVFCNLDHFKLFLSLVREKAAKV